MITFKNYFTEGHRAKTSEIPYGDNPFNMIEGQELVFFDTETTGLSPRDRQITEIAAVVISGDTFEVLNSYHVHIKLTPETAQLIKDQEPIDMRWKIKDILKMTNYYNSKADNDEIEAIEGFRKFIPEGALIVAHNAKFDLKMVNTRAKINGLRAIDHFGKVLDTSLLSREFFIPASQELEAEGDEKAKAYLDQLTTAWTESKKRQKISSRLGDLAKAMAVDLKNWHQAMADVEATIEIFKYLKKFFDDHFEADHQHKPDFIRRWKRARDLKRRR